MTIKKLIFSFLFILPLSVSFASDCGKGKSPIASGFAKPVVMYNNWSAYDELSDSIPQTEELCMQLLDEIVRLKKQGVQVDYYMMDAFWFDVDGGYRKWHKKNWPNGPQRWLDACKQNGITPGLWFATNLIQTGGKPMLNVVPEWQGSVTSDKAVLSLFEGGYLSHLMGTLQMYADMGFKLFKFDFAYFNAATDAAKATTLPYDIEELNKRAFIQAIKTFRVKNPDVAFIGFNGFGGDMDNTITPFRKTVDPRWLEIFETLYCGDPRISDVPMMNFWRSQDLYSDHMVKQFAFNGLPLSRIDDCAFMIGKTGTCYNRGINAWRGALILSLARGGWLNSYHGNIELLSDEDAAWFSRVQKTYLDLLQYGQTELFGGIPGKKEMYGYVSTSNDGTLFTLVNPTQSIQRITIPRSTQGDAKILFTDNGFEPRIEGDEIVLGAEQLVVVGIGKYNSDIYNWGIEKDILIPNAITPIPSEMVIKDNNTASVTVKPEDGNLRILFTQYDAWSNAHRSWGGAPPDGIRMNDFLKITAKQGNKNIPMTISYDKMIWSGLSWGAAEIEAKNLNAKQPITITCSAKDCESKYFKIELYNVK